MSTHSHTFHYEDEADLIRQMDDLLTRLTTKMEPYEIVRSRYPHLAAPAFCMRLKRFKGDFPHELTEGGRNITRLAVTRELHAHLDKKS